MSFWTAGAIVAGSVITAATAPDGESSVAPVDYERLLPTIEDLNTLSQDLGLDQLDWAKEQWPDINSLVDSIVQNQKHIGTVTRIDAQRAKERWGNVFQPMEDQLVNEANSYNSLERRQSEAAKASSDVAQAFDAQRQNAQRNLESYGIDPSQTRQQALDLNIRAQEAAAQAQAANEARDRTAQIGRDLRTDVIALGRDTLATGENSYKQSAFSDMTAANVQNAGLAGYKNISDITPYLGVSNQALSTGGNLLSGQSSAYNAQQDRNYQAQQDYASSVGTVAGAVGDIGRAYSTSGSTGGGFTGSAVHSSFAAGAADGGLVQGQGGVDAIPAQLTSNEYVIPPEVVLRKGTEFFDRMVAKTREGIPSPDQKTPYSQVTSTTMGQQAINTGGA